MTLGKIVAKNIYDEYEIFDRTMKVRLVFSALESKVLLEKRDAVVDEYLKLTKGEGSTYNFIVAACHLIEEFFVDEADLEILAKWMRGEDEENPNYVLTPEDITSIIMGLFQAEDKATSKLVGKAQDGVTPS